MDTNNLINNIEEISPLNELDKTNASLSESSKSSDSSAKNIFDELIKNAFKCIQSNDYIGAIRLYTEALKIDSTNHILYGNRSLVYCRIGKYEKALRDAIKARELNPTWSKAYYRQGIALQCLQRYPDALAAFASGLSQETKSIQLLSSFIETAMKSPLRATLEPIYRQLQVMNFDKSPFVITSVVGQELLAIGHYEAAVVVLESALRIGSSSMKLRGAVFSALSTAYWSLNDLDQAIVYMKQDLQVAQSLGDTLDECRAHSNLGSAFFSKCNYKESLASHRYQLVLAMKHGHTKQAASALTSLGHVYSAIGDLKNALHSHQQCLQIVRQLGNSLAEAREMGNVGAVHLVLGELEKAIECHFEHVKLAKLLGNKAEEARAYSNLGSAYHYRRQYEQAIQFHEQVLRLSQEIGDRTIESKAYAGLGHAARCMKDFIQAKRWYERQLDIALNTKDKASEARACSNLGIVYQLLGDFDGSLKLHWSHLNICKHINDVAGVGRAYGNIGSAYSALKQFEESVKFYKLELEITKEVHDRGSRASTHGNLAMAYQALGLHDQALNHFNMHLCLAQEIKDHNNEAIALCNLGNYYTSRKNYEKAIPYYEKYLKMINCITDKESEAKANHHLGFAYYRLKKYEKALYYFERDLELSKEIQDRNSMGRAFCHLGLVKSALKRFDDALECQKYYLCTVQGDPINKLKAMGHIATILSQQAKYSEAMKILEKKLALARSFGDVNNEANALKELGTCQKSAGNFEKAALYYKQELFFRQEARDFLSEIKALDNLGDSYYKYENYTLALKCFMEQLEKCELLRARMLSEQIIVNDYDSNGYYERRQQLSETLLEQLEMCQITSKAYHNVADTQFRMTHYEEASKFYQKEANLLDQVIERSERIICSKNFGIQQNESNDSFNQFLSSESKDSNLTSSNSQTSLLVKELVSKRIECNRFIGDCHFASQHYDEAIKNYLNFLSSSKNLIDQEQVYCLLGKCYQLVNNPTQALVAYEKRLVLAHEHGCNQTKAIAYGELGHIHRVLGNYEQAITCFKHEQELGKDPTLRKKLNGSLQISRSTESNEKKTNKISVGLFIEAEALHGLGCVAQEMHDYERALKYHSSALAIAQEIDSLELESRAYGAIGNAYNALGNYESAVRYQDKYLSVAQIVGDLSAQVCALSSLGKIYSSSGNYTLAVKYFQQALLIVEKYEPNFGQRDEEEARICYELGMTLWALNELEIAETHLRRSVDLIENFYTLNSSISRLTTTTMVPAPAYNFLLSTNYNSTCSSSGSSDASSTSSSHYGQLQLKNLIPPPTTTQPHHHYLHYQGASYEALIKILIALNRSTEALLIAERSRTRSFLKTKQSFKVCSITSIEQIIDMAQSQNAAILYYSMTIDGSYNSWFITPTDVQFSSLIKSSKEKITQLLTSLQASLFQKNFDCSKNDSANDDFDISENDQTCPLLHLKRNHYLNSSNYSLSSLFSLASSVTSTSTSSSRHSSMIRSWQRSNSKLKPSFFGSSSIQQTNIDPNSTIKNSKSNYRSWQGTSSLTKLYEMLIEPFQNQFDSNSSSITQLLLVLDGDLFLVPWGMLRNKDGEFLSEKYSLLITPSIGDYKHSLLTKILHKSDPQTTITSLVIANPTMPDKAAKTTSLNRQMYYENPSSSKEAAFVSELLSTRPLIGTEANKESVLSQLSSAQCIHFSSYIIDNTRGDPLKMATGLGIAISPSDVLIGDNAHQLQDHEYLLTPHDLISLGLSAKLVVISCCAVSSKFNSQAASINASTTFGSSQVLKTITSALLQAGASCVLFTLWPVPLSALQALFRIFYCSLLQGTKVSAALKEAVSTIQNTSHFSHPLNWAGFQLIGSDVRLSSQVALISSSLATLIKTPEKSRDAMRVVLHLIEKSLQRIQRCQKNAMYTTVQSIENKVGVNTQGWRELLISVGFRFEPASTIGLPACVFFPQSDPNGRLTRCSAALQAILALSQSTIYAISKLISNSEFIPEIIEQLDKVIKHQSSDNVCKNVSQTPSLSYVETVHIKVWSAPGCHELYASLGFDLMEVGSNSVKLHAGKNANIRSVMLVLQTVQALFDNENSDVSDSDFYEKTFKSSSVYSLRNKVENQTEEKLDDGLIKNEHSSSQEFHQLYSTDDPKNHRSKTTNQLNSFSIAELPCSRDTIGRDLINAKLIEQQLTEMQPAVSRVISSTITSLSNDKEKKIFDASFNSEDSSIHHKVVCNNIISADLQSISSQSSIATANTVLNHQPQQIGHRPIGHRRRQFSIDSTTSNSSSNNISTLRQPCTSNA